MLFFCEGNLNLETLPVDACVNSGKNCGQPAADAFCRYMGFEQAVEDLFTFTQADGPTRSMTGECSCLLHSLCCQCVLPFLRAETHRAQYLSAGCQIWV